MQEVGLQGVKWGVGKWECKDKRMETFDVKGDLDYVGSGSEKKIYRTLVPNKSTRAGEH
jgi:hypothetical protein